MLFTKMIRFASKNWFLSSWIWFYIHINKLIVLFAVCLKKWKGNWKASTSVNLHLKMYTAAFKSKGQSVNEGCSLFVYFWWWNTTQWFYDHRRWLLCDPSEKIEEWNGELKHHFLLIIQASRTFPSLNWKEIKKVGIYSHLTFRCWI